MGTNQLMDSLMNSFTTASTCYIGSGRHQILFHFCQIKWGKEVNDLSADMERQKLKTLTDEGHIKLHEYHIQTVSRNQKSSQTKIISRVQGIVLISNYSRAFHRCIIHQLTRFFEIRRSFIKLQISESRHVQFTIYIFLIFFYYDQ